MLTARVPLARATARAAAVFALSTVALASACVATIDDKFAAPADGAQSEAGPTLWRISDKDSDMWLFGAVHMIDPDVDWRRPQFDMAFSAAEVVYFERSSAGESDREAVAALRARGFSADEPPLSARLSPPARERLDRVARMLDIRPDDIDEMRPWYAGLWLGVRLMAMSGADGGHGVDRVLEAEARAAGLELRFFETSAQQVAFFSELSEAAQLAMLEGTLREIDEEPELIEALVGAWLEGDESLIAERIGAEYDEAPEAYEVIISQRNRVWAKALAAELAGEGSVLVVVGAAHLVGEDGLPALLRARGYAVERR